MPLLRRQYDFMKEEGMDPRYPAYTEEAFRQGIHFSAKFVGSLDVTRPQNRLEIVAAMRKIRYEFKTKAIKKKKVVFTVSVDGVFVTNRSSRKRLSSWISPKHTLPDPDRHCSLGSEASYPPPENLILHHPIFRIFYVSHDSQDLKIFSYIARDGKTSLFRCNVFKAYKKAQAMRIVRTVGQAFDVCHRISIQKQQLEATAKTDKSSPTKTQVTFGSSGTDPVAKTPEEVVVDSLAIVPKNEETTETDQKMLPIEGNESNNAPRTSPKKASQIALLDDASTIEASSLSTSQAPHDKSHKQTITTSPHFKHLVNSSETSLHHRLNLFRLRLDQEKQQTSAVLAEVHLLRDTLSAETAARVDGETRIHQLLNQNRDLLDHLNHLVHRIQQLEGNQRGHPVPPHASTSPPPSTLGYNTSIKEASASSWRDQKPWQMTVSQSAYQLGAGNTVDPISPLQKSSADNSKHSQPAVSTADNQRPQLSGQGLQEHLVSSSILDSPDSGHREMSADSLSQALTFSEAYPNSSHFNQNAFSYSENAQNPSCSIYHHNFYGNPNYGSYTPDQSRLNTDSQGPHPIRIMQQESSVSEISKTYSADSPRSPTSDTTSQTNQRSEFDDSTRKPDWERVLLNSPNGFSSSLFHWKEEKMTKDFD